MTWLYHLKGYTCPKRGELLEKNKNSLTFAYDSMLFIL